MKIIVNGIEQTIEGQNQSLIALLNNNNIKKPEMVSVQINGEFVEQEKFNTTLLKENDEVDFLFFMGGGSK